MIFMDNFNYILELIGSLCTPFIIYSVPFVFRKLNNNERLSPPEISFLFVYIFAGIYIVFGLVALAWGAFMYPVVACLILE